MTFTCNRVFTAVVVTLCAATASPQTAAPVSPSIAGLPLPDAMVRLSIKDVRAFNAALGGGFKKALYNTLPENDGVAAGFGQSQVGAKLTDQWARFRGDTELSFQTIVDLQTTSMGLAILNVGHLEMALVLQTPLAALPAIFEEGTSRIDHGRTYHLVRTGAGDEGSGGETRMGLVWSRDAGFLIITTSERAMKLTLAAMETGERFAPKLDGLASLELDTDALKSDLYFKREFLFGSLSNADESKGRISAAVRLDAGRLIEVREGALAKTAQRGATFDAPGAIASGWIGDASQLLAELRRGLLEPSPQPSLMPQLSVAALPSSRASTADDRYVTNIEVAAPVNGVTLTESAELDAWTTLLSAQPVAGFGYATLKSRARLLAIPWPKERDAEMTALIDATLTRRGARLAPSSATSASPASPASSTDAKQYFLGPNLPVLAFKRSGDFIWMAPTAADLAKAPTITWSNELVRFSKLNLTEVREEGKRWARIEGPRSPEHARPLSDRVLGLLGWMPTVRTLEVERRVTGAAFKERIVFGIAPPPAKSAASPAAKPAAK
ncbi:MAG: hypothetical protein ABI672_03330 [Vicinamibacteria bacterium]